MHNDMSPIQKSWERNNKTKILTPKTYCSSLKDKLSTQNRQHEDQHSLAAALASIVGFCIRMEVRSIYDLGF
ncbi:hypothetical protein NC653_029608 [Populus alba x Populus x berolinensis]|uniref:Uncharacterized protein n=1 Tax=Populus alba x Populus x berolinensis TaxID=444605 RepID=A0AAD6Q3P4_9ROSI|nr:hypothetical protein NC653_029608 [Populus alba x Populus x berolinensis]